MSSKLPPLSEPRSFWADQRSSALPSETSFKPWSFWDNPNYLNKVLFGDNSFPADSKGPSVSILSLKKTSWTSQSNLATQSLNERDVKVENVVSNPLSKKPTFVPNSDPRSSTDFKNTSVTNSTNVKTQKIGKFVISTAQPRQKNEAASSLNTNAPKSTETTSKVDAKLKEEKTEKVVKEVISTTQSSAHLSSLVADVVSSSSKWVFEDVTDLKDLKQGSPLKSPHEETALVSSQESFKKVTLKDIDDELSVPSAAAEYFLKNTFEEELKALDPKELLSVYVKLLQRSVSSFLVEKGKLSNERMKQVLTILNKHLCVLESGLIHKNDTMFFPILNPLIEICVNSSQIESCHLGLRIMIDYFSQPNPRKTGREVQLIENFLLNRKKVVFTGKCKGSEDWKKDIVNQYESLQETIEELEKVFLKAAPTIKYPEIALTFDVQKESAIAIEYFLPWLEKIFNSSQPYVETLTDKQCYDHLIKALAYCEEEDSKKIFNFFQCLPVEKLNFKDPKSSVQIVLLKLFAKKLMDGVDIHPNTNTLLEYCTNIWKLSPVTVKLLHIGFEKYLFAIREYINQPLPLFVQALELLTSQAELQNVIRLQKKMESSKKPQKTSNGRKKKAQHSKSNIATIDEDDIAENVHFKAASIVFNSLFDSAMRSLPTNKAAQKTILEDLWKLSFKAHVNFKFENKSSLLVSYLDSCDLENMDAQSEKMIQDILTIIDCEDQLDISPLDKSTGMFIKKCIGQGCEKIFSLDGQKRVTLYNNMMYLTDALMRCDIETQEKIDVFSVLLSILSKAVNYDQLALPLSKIFNRYYLHLYENNKQMYWQHYYNLGNVKEKRGISKFEDTKAELSLRREAIKTLISQLSKTEGTSSIKQMLEILKDREAIEFKDHFNELQDSFHLIFEKLLNEEKVFESLKLINSWFKEQMSEEDSPHCIFIKVLPKNTQRYSSYIEQEAHRQFMMELVTAYKTICEKSIEIDKELQTKSCETFAFNICYMIKMRGFEICNEKDLVHFQEFLNITYDFMKKYVGKGFTQFFLENLHKNVLEVFTRALIQNEAISVAKDKFLEEWKNLISPPKTKRIL